MLSAKKGGVVINTRFWAIMLFFTPVLSCSSPQTNNTASPSPALTEKNADNNNAFNACSIVDKALLEKILNGPVMDGKEVLSVQGSAVSAAISQCTFAAKTGKMRYVGIMIRRDPGKNINPHTKQEYLQKGKGDDFMGQGDEVSSAISNGKDVGGLGDLAFTYNYISNNLMIFCKGNYMIKISVYGRDEIPETQILDYQKMIAEKIITSL